MGYQDKEAELKVAKDFIGGFSRLHPQDEADAYSEMREWCGTKESECRERNDRYGVPEREVGE